MPPRSGQPSATERTGAAPPAATSAPEDDAAIRRAIALYARAIESKDLALFRSVKPNLSAQDERRLQDSFRAVDRQSVEITIISVDVHGQDASVALRRKDTIKARGQQHTTESRQTMTLTRAGGRWSIVDIR
jgi:ketosteroid isomerase-like protein